MKSLFENLGPVRRAVAVAGVGVVLASVAACGGTETSSGPSPSPSRDGLSLLEVREEGVLTVGTEGTYRPFTFHENGTGDLTGYDVEVVEAVADRLGVEVEFEETQWDAIFVGLEAGRFDVIANQVSINEERQAEYDFSTPYTVSPGVVVVNDGDDSIESFDDLAGKTTAQSLTSNWYQLAQDSGANVEAVEGWAQGVSLLKQGRVDATVNDRLTFLDYQQTEGDTSLDVAVETEERAENAFAFRKGSDSLVEAFDEALAELRADGTLAEISERYFGEDVSGKAG
jgi:L-cystine transport system substrate-binding protein